MARVIRNETVSPIAAGRPSGLSTLLVTDRAVLAAVCGAPSFAGGTGTSLVVVGAVTTRLIPLPLLTARKSPVMTVLSPGSSAPMSVQFRVPSSTLSSGAGTALTKLIRDVS